MLFSGQTKEPTKRPLPEHTRRPKNPPVERWRAVTNKKTELHLNLVKHDVDVFAIMEANLTAEKLIYYQLNGYTLYNLPKHRQIAIGILIGVRNSLCTDFKIVKKWATQKTTAK